MKLCGIYCLKNCVTGKQYVGQSRNIKLRLAQHSKGKEVFAVGRAIAKHGWAAFSVEVLEECEPESLNQRETHWIETLRTMSPAGYNLRTGGGQAAKFSDDVRAHISRATKAALTPERVALSAAKRRGIPKSPEWRAAMSERQRGEANVSRLRAMAAAQTAEARAKISASHMGKTVSVETRAKLSAVAKAEGRAQRMCSSPNYMSEAARAKMSASAKARCERARLAKAPAP